jgi:hypothetical protein
MHSTTRVDVRGAEQYTDEDDEAQASPEPQYAVEGAKVTTFQATQRRSIVSLNV